MATPTPPPRPDDEYPDTLIRGHKYDGIREYDNPMPGWWVALFWACIVFSVIYVLGIYAFGFVDTYEEDLAQHLEALDVQRTTYAETHTTFEATPTALRRYVNDPSMAQAGAAHYTTFCVACHGAEGQGGIGPNLTDPYWLHGGENLDLYNAITNGFPQQGMAPWASQLTPEARAQVVAFIRSLAGTNPPDAKPPQGVLVE